LKARLWEVLAIIGAAQLLVLPVIATSTRFRILSAIALLLLHATVSHFFNVRFVLAQPNVLDAFWGATDVRAWDGGFFGLISWTAIALAGTVAHDWMIELPQKVAIRRLLIVGAAGLLLGYLLSCLSTLYDVPEGETLAEVAESPVLPRKSPGLSTFAELPFSPAPPPENRQLNYWMMSKRLVSGSFVVFSTGFVFVGLGIFILLCDRGHVEVSVFRILGQNALAAYLLHYLVATALAPLVPKDSPLWYVLAGLAVFLGITIVIMRTLERRQLYLRL